MRNSFRRATLRLTLHCNNACIFCAQEGLSETAASAPLASRLAALRNESDELTFVGGEPTVDPSLVEAIGQARAAGFVRVGIQTNARGLANTTYTESLARAGLTDVHVSLHAADAAAHDYHTAVPGSFEQTVGGIAAARAARLTVVVTTVLTRSNFRVLSPLPRLLLDRGVAAWAVRLPLVAGRAGPLFDRIVPRFGMALPFALHAVEAARASGLPAFVQAAPLCTLGPLGARALADEPRAYGEVCRTCAARPSCPGVDPVYLARFGSEELSAREPPDVQSMTFAVAPELESLARMFVGVGESAMERAPSLAEVPAPTARVRAALPILGKVRPAANEARASVPKKSGEALRTIFPDLFDPPAGEDSNLRRK